MATILIAWELGGGLGHIAPLLPIIQGLEQRGHRVVAVVQDIVGASHVFTDTRVTLLQAPTRLKASANGVDPPRSFAHILHNSGFGQQRELQALASAWKNVFDLVCPDLIVFDHSPTALLAARCCRAKRIVIGTGFCCPVAETPFRDLRPWLPAAPRQLRRDEERVLKTANSVLRVLNADRLRRLSSLYEEVDDTVLTTFRELDHYTNRPSSEYWGTWSVSGGQTPDWPQGAGKRIFAYLKPFPAFPALLDKLKSTECPTIVYASNVPAALARRLSSPTMRLVTERLDLACVGDSCDMAILNGGHGTTAAMLLAGKPILQIPHYLEQSMTAKAVVKMRAGLAAERKAPEQVGAALDRLLDTDYYATNALRFAAKYANHRPADVIERVLDQCERLMRPKSDGTPEKSCLPR